jgi:hypothetical protein
MFRPGGGQSWHGDAGQLAAGLENAGPGKGWRGLALDPGQGESGGVCPGVGQSSVGLLEVVACWKELKLGAECRPAQAHGGAREKELGLRDLGNAGLGPARDAVGRDWRAGWPGLHMSAQPCVVSDS